MQEAEKLAGEELTTKQELIEELNTQIAQLRTSTAAAEAKRMDAQRREQASLDEARRWRNDTEGLREKLRRQDMAASREAAEASSREACATLTPVIGILLLLHCAYIHFLGDL